MASKPSCVSRSKTTATGYSPKRPLLSCAGSRRRPRSSCEARPTTWSAWATSGARSEICEAGRSWPRSSSAWARSARSPSKVAGRLARPGALGALLDESPEADEDVLAALVELDAAGLLTRVRADGHSAAFESPGAGRPRLRLTRRARIARASPGPSRVVFRRLRGRPGRLRARRGSPRRGRGTRLAAGGHADSLRDGDAEGPGRRFGRARRAAARSRVLPAVACSRSRGPPRSSRSMGKTRRD